MQQKLNSFMSSLANELSKLILASLTFVFVTIPMSAQEELLEEPEVKSEQVKEKMQDQTAEKIDEQMKYFKEKYEFQTTSGFQDTYAAILSVLADMNCQVMQKKDKQDDNGYFKGSIQSDYFVYALKGENKVKDSLETYSYKMPIIRGAIWDNARIQYKFILKENEDNSTNVTVKGELSGREAMVTNQVHFWQTNGWFETMMIEKIKQKLENK